jgi:hypothetical protein
LIADVLEDVVRLVIEDGIRAVGLVVLKIVTLGCYRSAGRSTWIVEGGIGLLVIAAVIAAFLHWVW